MFLLGQLFGFSGRRGSAASAVTPGSQTFSTPGSYSGASGFTVPNHNTLEVEVWGGGGSGAAIVCTGVTSGGFYVRTDVTMYAGTAGGQSSWNGTVIANGGAAAPSKATAAAPSTSSGGSGGGAASGGDINTTGSNGEAGYVSGSTGYGGAGGSAPNGAAGGARNTTYTNEGGNAGSAPGGGGGGCFLRGGAMGSYGYGASGGGQSGGYAKKTYSSGVFTPGNQITVVVGSGGVANTNGEDGGNGAAGRVKITWS